MVDDSYFTGKAVIVTGGASGIGKALVGALVARGARVTVADVDDVGAKAVAEASADAPGIAVAAHLDVTDAEAFATLARSVTAEHGHVDLLFNNAGIGVGGFVKDMSLAHWNRCIDVNLRGVVHGVAAVYPQMVERGRGHIVNTASLAGLLPGPVLTPYATTKHGVVGLSVSLRGEAAQHGVRVSVICPGVIDTPLLDKGNPPEVPPIEMPGTRAMLERSIGKAYPPEALARDVLAGVAANKAFIVSPRHARIAWRLYRLSPELMIRTLPSGMRRILGAGR